MVSNWPLVGWYREGRVIVLREQARSHIGMRNPVGAGLLAKRPEEASKI